MNTFSTRILNCPVSIINMKETLNSLQDWVNSRDTNYICCVPAHAVMDVYDHPELTEVYEGSGLNTPDGMAIVWLLRWAGHKNVERVYGPDLLLAACAYGLQRGWKHYFYGGTSEAVEKLSATLQSKFSGLKVVGTESPPFRPLSADEETATIERIQAARPDIVWVGLGSPKQEIWMHEHVNSLGVPVLVGVGAAFDFLSGNKPQAPTWVQRSGLEWLYRLVSEPRRLWKRYLIGYPRFVWLVLKERIRGTDA